MPQGGREETLAGNRGRSGTIYGLYELMRNTPTQNAIDGGNDMGWPNPRDGNGGEKSIFGKRRMKHSRCEVSGFIVSESRFGLSFVAHKIPFIYCCFLVNHTPVVRLENLSVRCVVGCVKYLIEGRGVELERREMTAKI